MQLYKTKSDHRTGVDQRTAVDSTPFTVNLMKYFVISHAAIKIDIRMSDGIPGTCWLAYDISRPIAHVNIGPYISGAGCMHPDFVLVCLATHGPVGHLATEYCASAA